MRTIILLSLVLLAGVFTNAQDYVPFPTKNAHWNIYLEYGAHESPPDTFLLRYTLGGDTIINSEQYTQLLRETGDTANPSNEYIGALREDGKKIYYRGNDYLNTYQLNDYKILLYDFSAGINDAIIHIAEHPQFRSIIINIDSVIVGSSYRKRYEINSSQNYNHQTEYWIEGIGSVVNGLLGHITSIPTCCYQYWEHVCYKDSVVELVNPNFNSCYSDRYITNINNPTFNHSQIRVYPNPIDKIIHVEISEFFQRYSINIYTTTGQLVFSDIQTNNQIDLCLSLSPGYYILKVSDEKGRIIGMDKFVK